MISEGRVVVGSVADPKPSTLVGPDEPIRLVRPPRYVSRGGDKLAGALERLPVPVEGRRALDAGASTGGFTDYLLQHGAAEVTAVDVGYGQLHWRLRADERVRVLERTNLRQADPGRLGAPFDLVVADLSFISLGLVAPVLAACGTEETDYVLLVKPQFELGREEVGRGGVVRDPDKHLLALQKVVGELESSGLGARAVVPSPLEGAKGNREFFVWARRGPATVGQSELARAVAA